MGGKERERKVKSQRECYQHSTVHLIQFNSIIYLNKKTTSIYAQNLYQKWKITKIKWEMT